MAKYRRVRKDRVITRSLTSNSIMRAFKKNGWIVDGSKVTKKAV